MALQHLVLWRSAGLALIAGWLANSASAQVYRQPAGPTYRRPAVGALRQPARQAYGQAGRRDPRAIGAPPGNHRPPADQGVVPAFYPAPLAVADARIESQPSAVLPSQIGASVPGEHPLLPAVRWAKLGMEKIQSVTDYSCTLVKRERIDGELGEHEYMFVKVRHQPFSIYIYFLGPESKKGQECLYVAGANNGKLLAHGTGAKRLFGTVPLDPNGNMAMAGNRYPITELGLRRLTERLIEVGEHDSQFGECEVKFLQNAKINKRDCTCIQVIHPVPRRDFLFHMARIYVDTEHNVPTRYEAYEWPTEPGGEPMLTEEYTYLNLKLNNGFTDQDFDTRNPNYKFR